MPNHSQITLRVVKRHHRRAHKMSTSHRHRAQCVHCSSGLERVTNFPASRASKIRRTKTNHRPTDPPQNNDDPLPSWISYLIQPTEKKTHLWRANKSHIVRVGALGRIDPSKKALVFGSHQPPPSGGPRGSWALSRLQLAASRSKLVSQWGVNV